LALCEEDTVVPLTYILILKLLTRFGEIEARKTVDLSRTY